MAMDPEEKRFQELTDRVRLGEATEVEREELAIYAEEDPSRQALIAKVQDESELGKDWLARAEADQARKESSDE